jgi:predicted GTPase
MSYSEVQLRAMAMTIEASDADLLVAATPIDLAGLNSSTRPDMHARYEFTEDPAKPLWIIDEAFLRVYREPLEGGTRSTSPKR